SMSRAPFVMLKPESGFPRGELSLCDTTIGWRFANPVLAAEHYPYSMGETAENVAQRYGISREDQDAFAAESQRRAADAIAAGRFRDEIVPVTVHKPKGQTIVVDVDEHPRPETTVETLAPLQPAFRDDGTVTAGNASGINDGASALLVVEAETAQGLGLMPRARVVATAVAGGGPRRLWGRPGP